MSEREEVPVVDTLAHTGKKWLRCKLVDRPTAWNQRATLRIPDVCIVMEGPTEKKSIPCSKANGMLFVEVGWDECRFSGRLNRCCVKEMRMSF